jgi:hypothetical protein
LKPTGFRTRFGIKDVAPERPEDVITGQDHGIELCVAHTGFMKKDTGTTVMLIMTVRLTARGRSALAPQILKILVWTTFDFYPNWFFPTHEDY